MKTVHIYPTSRAIRHLRQRYQEHNQLLPSLMRIDEFERRAIMLPNLKMVDSLQRRLLLQKAASFEAFTSLKINRDLVRFFTKSDAIFKFFEELSHEAVSFEDLIQGDAYVEFAEHIEILEELLEGYGALLAERGLTDRVFVPQQYQLNLGFVESYDRFELHLEGYMSRFELSLIAQIAQHRPMIVHLQTSKFNTKVQERFLEMGIELPMDAMVSFDLGSQRILETSPVPYRLTAQVWHVEERLQQIPLLLTSVQEMVNEGIAPEQIVVILPDESFKETLHCYDHLNNFNFAMGFDYAKSRAYKRLEAILGYWQGYAKESLLLLQKYAIEPEELLRIAPKEQVTVEVFFERMAPFGLDLERQVVEERWVYFRRIFGEEEMAMSVWLFLWLKQLSELSLDDVRGGKVTVMGALETRGVSYEGVVVIDFNDGIVPAIPAKDAFLNSSLRKFANLPTKNDREALQKQIYKRLLEQAKRATIIYSLSNNKMPAGYLYELGLGEGEAKEVDMRLLYAQPSQIIPVEDPIIDNFDATQITWSATRLKTLLTCRRKYYYQYVQQLQAKEEEQINEGAFLHKLLEHLFAGRSHFEDASELREAMHRLLDQLLPENDPKINYLKLLWRAKLEPFIATQMEHFNAGWRVMERERHIVGEIRGIRFKGVVDRIDQTDTHTLVLDYKSGSISEANRTKNLEKLTDFQMSIYAELLGREHRYLALAFVELFNGGAISHITLPEEKQERLYELIEELKSLTSLRCERCEEVSACQYCDYRLLCERGEYL